MQNHKKLTRTGIILSLNKKAGIGLIQDTNNERIKFFEADAESIPLRGELISFEIDFRNESLVATNIDLLKLEE